MPKQPGPDPTQQAPLSQSKRPGDDGPLAAAIAALPAQEERQMEQPVDLSALSDDELLALAWRAESDHVGNWPKGAVIPPGVIHDAAWVRKIHAKGAITVAEEQP